MKTETNITLTPFEKREQGATVFAVRMHMSYLLQETLRRLEEIEEFRAVADREELSALKSVIDAEEAELLESIVDAANTFENTLGIVA